MKRANIIQEGLPPRALITSILGAAMMLSATPGAAQTARDVLGPAAVQPLRSEPPARLIVDPPIPDALAKGRVFIQYRAENLRIVPVFGLAALAVSPRIGHIHVAVDDLPWHWADASGQELILTGLEPGAHKVLIELVNANHQTLDQATVLFTVPVRAVPAGPASKGP